MFCSTIIATINRPSLSRAVNSVLDQALAQDDFEVIVVNDTGSPLSKADWQHSPRARVLDTQKRERCAARNAGAAIARGRYLHFLDDDDWLLPGALEAFHALAQNNDAHWLYGAYETVDDEGRLVERIAPCAEGNIFALLVAGEGIPFQASLFDAAAFFRAGGFDLRMVGCEDRDVGRRVAIRGQVSVTSAPIARVRVGEVNSSVSWWIMPEKDREGRERAIGQPGAYARACASAKNDYWRGRLSRAYFASSVWNWKRGSRFLAASRALLGLRLAAPRFYSRDYRQGLRTRVARLHPTLPRPQA